MAFAINSSVFSNNGVIPCRYTCEGKDTSPPLSWTNIPPNAQSLVLIVDDPDAPDPKAPKMTYVHWLLYNIPVTVDGLAQGMKSEKLPQGILEGVNDWHRTGYGGPCPPKGEHRYFFKLYALDIVLSDLEKPTKTKLEQAMEGHVLEMTQIVGTYKKAGHSMKNISLHIASSIFLLVALAHIVRYFIGLSILVGTHHIIPVEWSLYGAVVSFILALWMFIAAKLK